jgi:integrase
MGRPPLALGEVGSIRTYGWHADRWWKKSDLPDDVKPEKWKAIANYRGYDGITAPVERHGRTEAKAKSSLNAEVRDRAGKRAALSARSKFRDFADLWLTETEERTAPSTMVRYRANLKNHVLPRLGELRISELRVSLLDDYFASLKDDLSPGARRQVRTVVKQIMDIPVRRDLIDHNPVKSVSRISGGTRRTPRSLSTTELVDFLTAVDADRWAARCDLPDLLAVMLGTGMRIGEACGLRWCDVVLGSASDTSLIQVTGNAVYIAPSLGRPGGVARHGGKTFAAQRNISVAPFLHLVLANRFAALDGAVTADSETPVFPNESGGLKNPAVFHNAIARLRRRISPADDPDRWAWLVSHILRKTAATQLDEGGATAREIADVLGHADPSMTQRVYMGRGLPSQRAAQILGAVRRLPVPS